MDAATGMRRLQESYNELRMLGYDHPTALIKLDQKIDHQLDRCIHENPATDVSWSKLCLLLGTTYENRNRKESP